MDLFNGKDLSGWVNVNCADTTFTVTADHMIFCNGKPTGVMRTEKMYGNFIAEFEYKHMVSGGNAGFFVWADALTARGVPFSRAIEVQIIDGWESADWTSHGDIFPIHGASMTPDRPAPNGSSRSFPSERRANGTGEWNHFRVTAIDGTIKLAVNGKEVSGGYDIQPRQGYLCLESEGGEVYYRNMRIKELPTTQVLAPQQIAQQDLGYHSLYNGRDFNGWDFQPEHQGHWRAQDWRLNYDGGSTDLWSLAEYGDFEMLVDWRWTGEAHKAMLPVILADGNQALDPQGQPLSVEVEECGDSGIYLRGSSKSQVNIWCWPVGSGEVYGYRTDPSMSAEVRAAVTPSENADAPLGQWNRFHITLIGDRLSVDLNGKSVIKNAQLPGVAERGRIALQNHGEPLEFANLYLREF